MDHIWMRHAETGGVARLPDIEAWRALGWEPSEAPKEVDPALAERVVAAAPSTTKTTPKKRGEANG